jgi:selenocysteine lyase/cysteine desulfurase
VVAGKVELLEQLNPDKLLPATNDVPERFELGTLPYELMAGTTAAINFLADLVPAPEDLSRRERLVTSLTALEHHEDQLRDRIETALKELPGVTIHSRARRRTPTLLVTFDGHDCYDIQLHLADLGVNAPADSFYALEASQALGLGDVGGLRIGLAPYTNDDDADRLIAGLNSYFES